MFLRINWLWKNSIWSDWFCWVNRLDTNTIKWENFVFFFIILFIFITRFIKINCSDLWIFFFSVLRFLDFLNKVSTFQKVKKSKMKFCLPILIIYVLTFAVYRTVLLLFVNARLVLTYLNYIFKGCNQSSSWGCLHK